MKSLGMFLRRLVTSHLIVGVLATIIHLFFGLLHVLRILNGTSIQAFVTSQQGLLTMGAFVLTWPVYVLSDVVYGRFVGYIVYVDIVLLLLGIGGALWAYFKTYGKRSRQGLVER